MDCFETPSWDEEKEAEKWTSHLFSTTNVIPKKIPKPRKRNKYPAGFSKSNSSPSANHLKNKSESILKEKQKNCLLSPANQGTTLLHKKNKKHKKPKTEDVEEKLSNKKTEETFQAGQEHCTTLSTTKRKKKSQTSDNVISQRSELDKSKRNIPNPSLKNEAEKKISNRSSCESVIIESVNEDVGSPVVLKRKKKRPRKSLENSILSAQKSGVFDKCDSKLNNDSQDISHQKRKQNDGSHKVKKSAEKSEVFDKCNSKSSPEFQAVFGKKRKQNEDNQVKKKKKAEVKSVSSEYEERISHLISGKTGQEENDSEEYITSKKRTESSSSNAKKTLRERMEEKLRAARFRFLNEQLYTSKSKETNKYFLSDPKAFEAYHQGYNQQLVQWPVKPVDVIIKSLKKKPKDLVIADFGCGDAKIARSLENKVHSFDHVALNDYVTVCDVAKTPLERKSVDVVIFCLSLMGGNLSDYISEANRVLKIEGLMKIAEVESRFDDVDKFVRLIGKFGFVCTRQNKSNDYFYLFDFIKTKSLKEGKPVPAIELRSCVYKKR